MTSVSEARAMQDSPAVGVVGGAHRMIRVAVTGCSHWHLPLYLDPIMRLDGIRLVGVSDSRAETAAAVGRSADCPWFGDVREMCEVARPDFVFALGRHCDMLADGLVLAESGVPFAMEKPCGLTHSEVCRLAAAVEQAGLFAAVPLVFRQTDLAELIAEDVHRGTVTNMAFRMFAGPPSRYHDAGCEWMLDPHLSGGGCTINLSVHFIDLMCALWEGNEPALDTTYMSADAAGTSVEDYSLLALTMDGLTCVVETGYLYPAPTTQYDMHFSVRSDKRYLVATTSSEVQIIMSDGTREQRHATTTNIPVYPVFVADVIARLRDDRPPVADVRNMARVMKIVDEAYERAGRCVPSVERAQSELVKEVLGES